MKSVLRHVCDLSVGVLVVFLLAFTASGEPANRTVSVETEEATVAPQDQLESLKLEIQEVLNARESALRDVHDRYEAALPEARTALEQEGARINEDYDRAYQELVAEYHRLSGNELEQQRAEAQLKALNSGVAAGTPLELDRSLTAPVDANEHQQREGVTSND